MGDGGEALVMRNLRNPDSEPWLWDPLNTIIQRTPGKERVRVTDVDGMVHFYSKGERQPTGNDRVLFYEGTTNHDKNAVGQENALKAWSLKPGVTVCSFVGVLPYPPTWVEEFTVKWSDGSLPASGFWNETRWNREVKNQVTLGGEGPSR